MKRVPIQRVALIAARGECWHGCRHRDCDAARLAREVLERRLMDGTAAVDEAGYSQAGHLSATQSQWLDHATREWAPTVRRPTDDKEASADD